MISQETADRIFQAVQVLRDELPLVGTVIETLDPAAIPIVELVEPVLSKVFEAVSVLLKHQNPEQYQASLAAGTVQSWQHLLNARAQ